MINKVRIDESYIDIVIGKSYDKKSSDEKIKAFSSMYTVLSAFILSVTLLSMYLYPESRNTYLKYFIIFIVFSSVLLIYCSLNLIYKKNILEGILKKVRRAIVSKAIKSKLDTVTTIEITKDTLTVKTNKNPFISSGDWSGFSSYSLNHHFYVLQNYQNTYCIIIDQKGFENEEDKEKFEEILNAKLEYVE